MGYSDIGPYGATDIRTPALDSIAPQDRIMALDHTIENICLKAIAKEDRDRYVTAKAFADDLTKWLSGRFSTSERASFFLELLYLV